MITAGQRQARLRRSPEAARFSFATAQTVGPQAPISLMAIPEHPDLVRSMMLLPRD